jgi:hypothetical protein
LHTKCNAQPTGIVGKEKIIIWQSHIMEPVTDVNNMVWLPLGLLNLLLMKKQEKKLEAKS